jgi:cation:H+ antiporter
MIGAAFACLPVFFTGYKIARWEGAIFLGYYVAYTVYLILKTTGDERGVLPAFRTAMLWYVIPLTLLTFGVTTFRALRSGNSPSSD